MQIVVVGCGKVGSRLASVLSRDGHDVVIIDRDPNNFKLLDDDFSGITNVGVPIDQDILKASGIETCDVLAAVTPDDNINIMVCQVAKEIFNVKKVIARIYDPAREQVFKQFGLDTVCPTNITVDVIRSLLVTDAVVSSAAFDDHEFNFINIEVEKDDAGKLIQNIEVDKNTHVFGIIRGGKFKFARPDVKIAEGDTLIVCELLK